MNEHHSGSTGGARLLQLQLRGAGPVRIGDYTLFGPGVQILTPLHPTNAELRRRQEYGKAIDIGDDVWVGAARSSLPERGSGPARSLVRGAW